MPSNAMFRQIHRDEVFHGETAFANHNLVRGPDHESIRNVFSDEVRRELADNDALVIEARPEVLAFFLHGERVMPKDLDRFVDDAVRLGRLLPAG